MQTDVSIKSSTPLSAGTGRKDDYRKKVSQIGDKINATSKNNKNWNEATCSWLVCRLGLEGFHVSGGGGLKGRGGVAEEGFWLLPASSPSPIAVVGHRN